ncbi:MAG: hypothetical protein B6I36_10015, partial [Desulfobacteraceae bacterium 4572_35.1]
MKFRFNKDIEVMIKFKSFASGSAGNCTMVEVDGELLLFDVGITLKRLKVCLGEVNRSIDDISAVLVSHAVHIDHIRGAKALSNKIAMLRLFAEHKPTQIPAELHYSIRHGVKISTYRATITPFRLSHDDPCTGYTVEDKAGNKIAIVADSGCFPEESIPYLFGCDLIQIEFNYDRDMLEQSPYNENLKDRIRGNLGHMENRKAREVLECVAWDGLKYVVPAHLSDTNNDT